MNYDRFKPLRDAIQNETFSRQQLGDLLGDVAFRICRMPDGELDPVQHDLSDAHEAYLEALDKIEEREARVCTIDEMDLARIKRACGNA